MFSSLNRIQSGLNCQQRWSHRGLCMSLTQWCWASTCHKPKLDEAGTDNASLPFMSTLIQHFASFTQSVWITKGQQWQGSLLCANCLAWRGYTQGQVTESHVISSVDWSWTLTAQDMKAGRLIISYELFTNNTNCSFKVHAHVTWSWVCVQLR